MMNNGRNEKGQFIIGRKETAEEKLKRITALTESWKNREDYIADITIDWMINNIIMKPCVYCGDSYRVGCDRINNDLGHTMDNVVPCCYDCNCARNNNFSYEEMLIIGKTIHEVKQNRIKN